MPTGVWVETWNEIFILRLIIFIWSDIGYELDCYSYTFPSSYRVHIRIQSRALGWGILLRSIVATRFLAVVQSPEIIGSFAASAINVPFTFASEMIEVINCPSRLTLIVQRAVGVWQLTYILCVCTKENGFHHPIQITNTTKTLTGCCINNTT